MTSEIRTNSLKSRAGLSTVTLTDSGPMFSGITTFVDNSGFNIGTGSSIFSPATNTLTLGTNSSERLRISSVGELTSTAAQANVATFTSNQTASTIFVKDTDGDGIFISGSSAYGHRIYTNTSENLLLGTNNLERLRITTDNVLIHTTDSTTMGTVNKNLIVGSTTNNHEVGLTLNVMEGTNNRRVKFFLDDDDGVFGIDSTASTGVPPFVIRGAGTERVRVTSDGVITTTQSVGNIGIDLHATGSGRGSQIKFQNDHGVAYVGQAGDTTGNFLLYNETATPMLFYSGTVNTLNLYTNREARFSGYVVAQTMGSGTSSQTASFGATQSGMSASSYNYILSGSNDVGNRCVLFVNGSSRSTDGGTNALTLRNDGGNLNLGNSATNTIIHGGVSFAQSINQQQTKFRYTNSGGVGAYLSLFNNSTTAGSSTGISFGIGNSDAQLDGSDWGEGQIKVYTDSGGYGNMEFNCHTNANRSWLKIVGNGQGFNGASAGTESMRGGVAFGAAGLAIDRAWYGQPGIHVFNQNVEGDTDQGTLRFHGWDRSYASYPNNSGSDFGVSLVADGMNLTSDRRRKTDIATITGALDKVSQMRGVSFTYVNRDLEPQIHMSMDNGKKLGFIAQEVIPILPQLIHDSGEKAIELENGYCDRYNMDYGGVTPLLVEAIKELKTKIENLEQDNIAELKTKIENLEQDNIALRSRITNLEGE